MGEGEEGRKKALTLVSMRNILSIYQRRVF